MQMTDPFIQRALSKTFYGRVSFHIPTDKLEDYILLRYEQDAPQCELDILETAFSARITEDDILMTEDDDRMSEDMINGASLEECLFDIYSRYLEQLKNPDGTTTEDDFLAGLRECLLDAGWMTRARLKENVTPQQMWDAAKDVYDRKIHLRTIYKKKHLALSP
jgi:hypothetical protein